MRRRQSHPVVPSSWDHHSVKQHFLDECGTDGDGTYGYGLTDDELVKRRREEYPALKDAERYLDYASSPPLPISSVQSLTSLLSSTHFSNPHSHSLSSTSTSTLISSIRQNVLKDIFGLQDRKERDQWMVIWTSGTTGAIKLIAESYPFSPARGLRYVQESHTSLVGLRAKALSLSAPVALDLPDNDDDNEFLFAYPHTSNLTGSAENGVELARKVKRKYGGKAMVLMDAAAGVGGGGVDLSGIPIEEAPDFIACSTYKIYGYPTSLGVLLLKRSSLSSLQRTYFGGGTLDALSLSSPFWHVPRSQLRDEAAWEDGTIGYLEILALGESMKVFERLYGNLKEVGKHQRSLGRFARTQLAQLEHGNSAPVIQLHSPSDDEGSHIVSFSVLDNRGRYVGYKTFNDLAVVQGFSVRVGGMCNEGTLGNLFGLRDEERLEGWKKGRRCGDDNEFDPSGKPLGVIRISFGAASTVDDVLAFVGFMRRFWCVDRGVEEVAKMDVEDEVGEEDGVRVESIVLYPIKSCHGQSVLSWPLTPYGLSHDRSFILVDPSSRQTLSQKRYPRMALIRPEVDLEMGLLRVRAEGMDELVLPLESDRMEENESVGICMDSIEGKSEGAEVDKWFSTFLEVECSLLRVSENEVRHGHFERSTHPVPILASNESPFLIISSSSVRQVNEWILPSPSPPSSPRSSSASNSYPVQPSSFRSNFILSSSTSLPPFAEDELNIIRLGSQTLQVLAKCRRCLMVCIDQEKGVRMKEPFSCLSRMRRENGGVWFGVHAVWRRDLSTQEEESVVKVGDRVRWTKW